MQQSEFEKQLQKLHGIEVALESALEQARAIRLALVQEFTSSVDNAPKAPVVQSVEPVALPPILDVALSNEPHDTQPRKRRRAACAAEGCKEFHWNGRGSLCDLCTSKAPILEGAT